MNVPLNHLVTFGGQAYSLSGLGGLPKTCHIESSTIGRCYVHSVSNFALCPFEIALNERMALDNGGRCKQRPKGRTKKLFLSEKTC